MAQSMTKKELANIAGYTYRRLHDIDRDLPDNKKLFVESEGGKYDLALFVQRWVKYNVENEAGDEDDLDLVKARHEAVKMQKTELMCVSCGAILPQLSHKTCCICRPP